MHNQIFDVMFFGSVICNTIIVNWTNLVSESTGSSAVNCIDELPLYLRILVFDPTTVFKSKRDRAQVRELKVTGPLQSQYWFKIPAEWLVAILFDVTLRKKSASFWSKLPSKNIIVLIMDVPICISFQRNEQLWVRCKGSPYQSFGWIPKWHKTSKHKIEESD